jgi:hypothetical protein
VIFYLGNVAGRPLRLRILYYQLAHIFMKCFSLNHERRGDMKLLGCVFKLSVTTA